MSEFGEQLKLPLTGNGEARCSHTHDLYVLNDAKLTKHSAKSLTGSK
jgi:UDP-2-acetamido-3-amino-2,3-dideoxy-glucuronate N-acetyltransferase